jgi:orotate phosphoribosyltransferase
MKRKIGEHLLNIKAVFLSPDKPFIWASGIKSPIYCDNRITLSDHSVREDIERGLAEIIRNNYPECEVIMGTSTAGIAHAAITAHMLGLPMGYVRSAAKDHGRGNRL